MKLISTFAGFVVAAVIFALSVTAHSEENTFDITEILVSGNTLLTRSAVERAVYWYLGKNKTIDDVEAARKTLEEQYRLKGFPTVAVNIPEQQVAGGVVKLEVVEGKLDRVRVIGSDYFSIKRIKEKLPALKRDQALYMPAVQEQLSQLQQRSRDRTITPVLKPGMFPGTVDVDLKVEDKLPLHGSLEYSNRNTENTTDTRMAASIQYSNLFQREHTIGLKYITAPEEQDESSVFVGTYIAKIDSINSIFVAYGVQSDSAINVVDGVTSLGKGNVVGLNLVKLLPQQGNFSHNLSLALTRKDFEDSLELNGELQEGEETPIEYMTYGLDYSTTVKNKKSTYSTGIGVLFGSRLSSQDADQFEKRDGAKPNFTLYTANFSANYALPADSSIAFNGFGQIADSPLISNEMFSVGGFDSVRGYHESQAANDEGLVLGLDITNSTLSRYTQPYLDDFSFTAFIEGAKLWRLNPSPDEDNTQTLSSAGLQLDLGYKDYFSSALLLAFPFEDAGTIQAGDERFQFDMRYSF